MIRFYQDLDLPYEGFKVPLTFKIGGIGEIIGYVGGGSTEFELQATPRNEALLSEFKGRSVPVILQVADRELQGRLLVKSRKVVRGVGFYLVQFDDLQTELAVQLKNTRLRDIYLEDYNHAWTLANITDTTRTEGWVYPLVYYTDEANAQQSPPFISATSLRRLLFPAAFVHTLFRRIFEHVGYSISSRLLDDGTSVFNRLIEPFTSGNWSKGGIGADAGNQRRVDVGFSTNLGLLEDNLWAILPFDVELPNGSIYYNTSTFRYTPDINIRCQFIIGFQITNAANVGGPIRFRIWNHTTSQEVAAFNGGNYSIIPANGQLSDTFFLYDQTIELLAGNDYEVQYQAAGGQLTITTQSYFQWVTLSDLQPGDPINFAATLPDVSCADYLTDLARIMCIAFDVDPETRSVYFDTWNNFFAGQSEAIDLTEAINIDDIQEGYIPKVGQRNYFLWSDQTFYASGGYRVENPYLEAEQTAFELFHSPTEMHRAYGLIVPKIIGLSGTSVITNGNSSIALRYPKTTPRLLIHAAINPGDLNADYAGGLPVLGLETPLTTINYAYFYNPYNDDKLDAQLDLVFQGTFEPRERTDASINLMQAFWSERVKYNQDYLVMRATAKIGSATLLKDLFRKPIYHEALGYFRLDEVVDYSDSDLLCTLVLSRIPTLSGTNLVDAITANTVSPSEGRGAGSDSNQVPTVINQPSKVQPHVSLLLDDPVSPGTNVQIQVGSYEPYYQAIGSWVVNAVGGHDAVFFPEAGKYYISLAGEFEHDSGSAELIYRIYDETNTLIIERNCTDRQSKLSVMHVSNSEQVAQGWYVKIFASFSNALTFAKPYGYFTIFKTD